MTKAQLLVDLKAKDFVSALVNNPEMIETKPNGDKWYQVNIREVIGNVGTYRNVHFYVANEGTKDELAFYKDAPPVKTIRTESEQEEAELVAEDARTKLLASINP